MKSKDCRGMLKPIVSCTSFHVRKSGRWRRILGLYSTGRAIVLAGGISRGWPKMVGSARRSKQTRKPSWTLQTQQEPDTSVSIQVSCRRFIWTPTSSTSIPVVDFLGQGCFLLWQMRVDSLLPCDCNAIHFWITESKCFCSRAGIENNSTVICFDILNAFVWETWPKSSTYPTFVLASASYMRHKHFLAKNASFSMYLAWITTQTTSTKITPRLLLPLTFFRAWTPRRVPSWREAPSSASSLLNWGFESRGWPRVFVRIEVAVIEPVARSTNTATRWPTQFSLNQLLSCSCAIWSVPWFEWAKMFSSTTFQRKSFNVKWP